ncbi:MAG: hypothetical protein N3E51_04420 [Candidatus Micrarchaeota archaeon]|nr:hypothetical protein [Candidatus Micrarchaeota archaeon]
MFLLQTNHKRIIVDDGSKKGHKRIIVDDGSKKGHKRIIVDDGSQKQSDDKTFINPYAIYKISKKMRDALQQQLKKQNEEQKKLRKNQRKPKKHKKKSHDYYESETEIQLVPLDTFEMWDFAKSLNANSGEYCRFRGLHLTKTRANEILLDVLAFMKEMGWLAEDWKVEDGLTNNQKLLCKAIFAMWAGRGEAYTREIFSHLNDQGQTTVREALINIWDPESNDSVVASWLVDQGVSSKGIRFWEKSFSIIVDNNIEEEKEEEEVKTPEQLDLENGRVSGLYKNADNFKKDPRVQVALQVLGENTDLEAKDAQGNFLYKEKKTEEGQETYYYSVDKIVSKASEKAEPIKEEVKKKEFAVTKGKLDFVASWDEIEVMYEGEEEDLKDLEVMVDGEEKELEDLDEFQKAIEAAKQLQARLNSGKEITQEQKKQFEQVLQNLKNKVGEDFFNKYLNFTPEGEMLLGSEEVKQDKKAVLTKLKADIADFEKIVNKDIEGLEENKSSMKQKGYEKLKSRADDMKQAITEVKDEIANAEKTGDYSVLITKINNLKSKLQDSIDHPVDPKEISDNELIMVMVKNTNEDKSKQAKEAIAKLDVAIKGLSPSQEEAQPSIYYAQLAELIVDSKNVQNAYFFRDGKLRSDEELTAIAKYLNEKKGEKGFDEATVISQIAEYDKTNPFKSKEGEQQKQTEKKKEGESQEKKEKVVDNVVNPELEDKDKEKKKDIETKQEEKKKDIETQKLSKSVFEGYEGLPAWFVELGKDPKVANKANELGQDILKGFIAYAQQLINGGLWDESTTAGEVEKEMDGFKITYDEISKYR